MDILTFQDNGNKLSAVVPNAKPTWDEGEAMGVKGGRVAGCAVVGRYRERIGKWRVKVEEALGVEGNGEEVE